MDLQCGAAWRGVQPGPGEEVAAGHLLDDVVLHREAARCWGGGGEEGGGWLNLNSYVSLFIEAFCLLVL